MAEANNNKPTDIALLAEALKNNKSGGPSMAKSVGSGLLVQFLKYGILLAIIAGLAYLAWEQLSGMFENIGKEVLDAFGVTCTTDSECDQSNGAKMCDGWGHCKDKPDVAGEYCWNTSDCANIRINPGSSTRVNGKCLMGSNAKNICAVEQQYKYSSGSRWVVPKGTVGCSINVPCGNDLWCDPGAVFDGKWTCVDGKNPGQFCFIDDECKTEDCSPVDPILGIRGVCANEDGSHPTGSGCTLMSNDCGSAGYCAPGSTVCRPKLPVGSYCPIDDKYCASGHCSGWSECYDPTDPCRCRMEGTWGDLCGNWDAESCEWCYVKDAAACNLKSGHPKLTPSETYDLSWKCCSGNY